MNESDTPTRRLPIGGISLEERLQHIDDSLIKLLEQNGETATEVALIKSKLTLHDWILGGMCSAVGIAVVTALLLKVIH